jgi:uncharacterized protein YndB with AHSA1/START domain
MVNSSMNRYALVSYWHLDAPIDRVWAALFAVDEWPRWWKYVLAVQEIEAGDTWGSRLPYRLSFQMRVTVVQQPYRLEGEAFGELIGSGRWSLQPEDATTHVRYDWDVQTSRRWMNALAPLLSTAFKWNHGQVMAEGARGLARHLAVPLLNEISREH